MAKSSEHEEENEEADKSDVDEEIPPLVLGPEDFRKLLTRGENNAPASGLRKELLELRQLGQRANRSVSRTTPR